MSHAVLLGQIGPTFCQALCLSLPLHQISRCPGEYFLPFGFLHLFPTHFASFIQNDITKLQKNHSLDLSYLVTKSIQLHFLNKDGGGRILTTIPGSSDRLWKS